jgi:hypothetical protein
MAEQIEFLISLLLVRVQLFQRQEEHRFYIYTKDNACVLLIYIIWHAYCVSVR